jgi:hypothetical protein
MNNSYSITNLSDIAAQPKSLARWVIYKLSHQVAPIGLQDEQQYENFAKTLRKYLINAWRITKQNNKDITSCSLRELKDYESNIEEENVSLGKFLLLDVAIAPDQTDYDANFGPQAVKCEIIFCMGKTIKKDEESNFPSLSMDDDNNNNIQQQQQQQSSSSMWYPFCLARGKIALLRSVLDWLKVTHFIHAETILISSDRLSSLASQWTRRSILNKRNIIRTMMEEASGHGDDNEQQILSRRPYAIRLGESKLEITFQLPSSSSSGTSSSSSQLNHDRNEDGDDDAVVHVVVEEDSLNALYDVVKNTSATTTTSSSSHHRMGGNEENDDYVSNNTTSNTILALTAHLNKHLAVNLQGALIVGITTPVAELNRFGQIKFFWPQQLKSVIYSLDETIFKA